MITTGTLFVFGAGLSWHYGFPTGSGLVEIICEKALNPNYIKGLPRNGVDSITDNRYLTSNIFQAVSMWRTRNKKNIIAITNQTDPEKVINDMLEFRENLRYSDAVSIDSFIRKNPEFSDVGKATIAAVISDHENSKSLFYGHWTDMGAKRTRPYQMIWDKLIQGTQNNVNSLLRNKIGFITFNYDRSWEFYISRVIRSYFNQQAKLDPHWDSEYKSVCSFFRPYHVYGTLSDPPQASADFPYYTEQPLTNVISSLANSIDSIHTIGVKSGRKNIADDFLDLHRSMYKNVVFVGFGYNPENIIELDLGSLFVEGGGKVVGSSMGFTDTAKILASNHIRKGISRSGSSSDQFPVYLHNMDCYDFLSSVLPEIA